jgi:hypothetical protein
MKIPLVLKTYFSPFKPLKINFYFGKTAIGVPIYFPRIWRKLNSKEILIKANKSFYNDNLLGKSFDEWVEHHKSYKIAVSKKVGFDFRDFFWKTKWERDDYRFEFNAVWSFVFFGWQIALTFYSPYSNHYFECFLAYHFETDKKLSVSERLNDCIKRYPCSWTKHNGEKKETVDYWKFIIKQKYL